MSEPAETIYVDNTDYTKVKYRIQNNLAVIFDLKSQLLHILLFVTAAFVTIYYAFDMNEYDYRKENKVILTNFLTLDTTDFKEKTEIVTHNNLNQKWLCQNATTSTAMALMGETWGPDSMCRCFQNQKKRCTTQKECVALEKSCYRDTVPPYQHVFAGIEMPWYSILCGFFLLHISVLLNMTTEVIEEKITDPLLSSLVLGQNENNEYENLIAQHKESHIKSRFKYFGIGDENSNNNASDPNDMEYNTLIHNPVPIPAKKQVNVRKNNINAGKYSIRPECAMSILSRLLTNATAMNVVLVLLSITVIGFNVAGYLAKEGARGNNQKCIGSLCLIETLSFTVLLVVSFACCLFSFCNIVWPDKRSIMEISVESMRSALEEITLISGCMSLVAAFTAMSGVHDDTTILFDVIAVLFIGFVQALQHKIMVMREKIMTVCAASSTECIDGLGKKHTLSSEVLGYFLHTRLFIFVVIITSVYVFFERVQPTAGSADPASTWNLYMRNVALLVSLLPNILSDLYYELQHGMTLQTTGDHTKYIGPARWRRTIYLLYIIAFVFAEKVWYSERPLSPPPP